MSALAKWLRLQRIRAWEKRLDRCLRERAVANALIVYCENTLRELRTPKS